jgi:hypothetical protein
MTIDYDRYDAVRLRRLASCTGADVHTVNSLFGRVLNGLDLYTRRVTRGDDTEDLEQGVLIALDELGLGHIAFDSLIKE